MNNLGDKASFYFNRAVELLFLSQPTRTSMGIVLGLVLDAGFAFFKPLLSGSVIVDVENLRLWHLIALGVLVTNMRSFVDIFRKQTIEDENIDKIIHLIEQAEFSKEEKRQQYRLLLTRVVDKLILNEKPKAKLVELETHSPNPT